MEKRQHPRTPHLGNVLVQRGRVCQIATYQDLSVGGALLSCEMEVVPGDDLFLIFESSNCQIYRCRATAKRCQDGQVALQFQRLLRPALLDQTLAA